MAAVPAVPRRLVTLLLLLAKLAHAWTPDSNAKLTVNYGEDPAEQFLGNATAEDFFRLLDKGPYSIIIGGRNTLYNLSLYDLAEDTHQRIEWHPTLAHRELCALKGKSKVDCQNYLRVSAHVSTGMTLVCGTNAYKPLCRLYHPHTSLSGSPKKHKEFEGIAMCPYNPQHNSTSIYVDGQLYSGTMADFSETDPLIYREPQRTERSDLRQLNNPSFVNSMMHEDYVYFFYRETAVEYMNCGKAIYSRVARVCSNDRGGPHQTSNRWTSFLKARLNCSIPGEYPFYFDEIQSMSELVSGNYGESNIASQVMYGVFTTPSNSIGGSAVCAFAMRDIIAAFDGDFKGQENINANWLPLDSDQVPLPRPGKCVKDSRTLPDAAINFVKTHSLMENGVPSFLARPLLVRVSFMYRFTAIAVHPQVQSINDNQKYDIIYVGTDDGRIIKTLNAASSLGDFENSDNEDGRSPVSTIVVSDVQVLPKGVPVKQLHVSLRTEKLIVISDELIKTMPLHHCNKINDCSECMALQDPHCAWDSENQKCAFVGMGQVRQPQQFFQDIINGSQHMCNSLPQQGGKLPARAPSHRTVFGVANSPGPIKDQGPSDPPRIDEGIQSNEISVLNNAPNSKHEPDSLRVNRADNMMYTAQALNIAVAASCLVTLLLGFVVGYLFSRRFRHPFLSDTTPFHEQHNRLNRLTPHETPLNVNSSQYLPPRANKTINLVVNVPAKQDNLQHELGAKDRTHECKNSNESLDKDIKCGTLQKVKKTYI